MGHISILPPSFHIKLKLHGGGWIKFITDSIQFGFDKEGHEYNIFNPLKHQIKENQRVTMTHRRTKLLPRINFCHNWSTNRLTNQLDECKIVATAGCTLQLLKHSLRAWGGGVRLNLTKKNLMGDLAFPSCSSGILCYHKQGRTQHRTWVYMYTR